jgi:hypothetical protein
VAEKHCWEFKKCGREPGGTNAARLGVCPASAEAQAEAANAGKNGCRACWSIAGKFSREMVHGSPGSKHGDCLQCGFFKMNENNDELYEVIVREVISLM